MQGRGGTEESWRRAGGKRETKDGERGWARSQGFEQTTASFFPSPRAQSTGHRLMQVECCFLHVIFFSLRNGWGFNAGAPPNESPGGTPISTAQAWGVGKEGRMVCVLLSHFSFLSPPQQTPSRYSTRGVKTKIAMPFFFVSTPPFPRASHGCRGKRTGDDGGLYFGAPQPLANGRLPASFSPTKR